MINLNPQYITDFQGKKISAILPIKDFEKLLSELDDLEDIRLYDEAKTLREPSISAEEAFKKIEAERKTANKCYTRFALKKPRLRR